MIAVSKRVIEYRYKNVSNLFFLMDLNKDTERISSRNDKHHFCELFTLFSSELFTVLRYLFITYQGLRFLGVDLD